MNMQATNIVPIGKRRASAGGNGGNRGLARRVSSLEERMTAVEKSAKEAAANSAQILSVLQAGKGVASFIKKHGPRAMAFGIGIAVSHGYISDEIGKFLSGFFG